MSDRTPQQQPNNSQRPAPGQQNQQGQTQQGQTQQGQGEGDLGRDTGIRPSDDSLDSGVDTGDIQPGKTGGANQA